jgi:ubiquinone biosynthesis protein UbiJ
VVRDDVERLAKRIEKLEAKFATPSTNESPAV